MMRLVNNKAFFPEKVITLLLVDDNKDLRELMRDMINLLNDELYDYQIKIIEASDGFDATLKFRNQEFDLIITDQKMPKKEGTLFIQDLISRNQLKKEQVIFISGEFNPNNLNFFHAMGFKYLIEKPINEETFLLTVKNRVLNAIKSKEVMLNQH